MTARALPGPIVDSHAHVWDLDPEKYPWQPLLGYVPEVPAPPERLLTAMDDAGVQSAVLVQPSVYGWDHRYLFGALRTYPQRFVGVGLLDPDGRWREALAEFRCHEIRGIRFNLVARRSASWINAKRYTPLWQALESRGLAVCFQAHQHQLPALRRFAATHRGITVVVDHLGKPDLSLGTRVPSELLRLADFDRVHLKASGFYLHSRLGPPWPDFDDFLTSCVRSFGPRRLMWGSDAPSALKSSGYADTLLPIRRLGLPEPDARAILAETATNVFGSPKVARTSARELSGDKRMA